MQTIDGHQVKGSLEGISLPTLRTVLAEAFREMEQTGSPARVEFPLPNKQLIVVAYPATLGMHNGRYGLGEPYAVVRAC